MGWYYRIYNGNYRGILESRGVGLVKFVVFFGKKNEKTLFFEDLLVIIKIIFYKYKFI